jgi:hypothetical protein
MVSRADGYRDRTAQSETKATAILTSKGRQGLRNWSGDGASLPGSLIR